MQKIISFVTGHTLDLIRYNRSWSIQALTFISLICYIWITTFNHYYANYSLSYTVARSCGAILKYVLMPSIIVPILRVLYTEVRNSSVGRLLGLDRRLADHKIFAVSASFFAIVHMVAHYLHDKNNFGKQAGITGIIMLLSLAVPLAGVFLARWFMKWIQKFSYSTQILRPHQIGATIFIAAYSYHVEDGRLFYFGITMYGFYLFDRITEYFKYTFTTKIQMAKRIDGTNFIMLEIDRPKGFSESLPGQFALLSLGEIDKKLECYHPFTITNDDKKTLSFLIQKTGQWTNKLWDLINERQTGHGLTVTVIGPFGSTLNCFNKHKSISLVGSGIGMTPFISYLNYCFTNNRPIPITHLIISQRSFKAFIPCMDMIIRLGCKYDNLNIIFYLTGVKSFDELIDEVNEYCKINKLRIDIYDDCGRYLGQNDNNKSGNIVKLYLGRVSLSWPVFVSQAVATCGSYAVTSEVAKFARKDGKKCYIETY